MKILYTSDWHLKEEKPINRIDEDFLQVQFQKIQEVQNIAKEYEVDYILHGGDLFHFWKTSLFLTGLTIAKLKNFPMIGNIGNHDILGYNINTLKESSLGVLFKSGVLKNFIDITNDFKKIGYHFKYIPTRHHSNVNIDDYKCIDENSIILSHDMITNENVPFESIYYKELEGKAFIILCAHYHKPFIIKTKKTLFVNPGALIRLTIDDNFEPGVIILNLTKNDVLINRVKLSCAKPFKCIFNIEKKEEKIEIPKFDIEKINCQNLTDKIQEAGILFHEDSVTINEAIKRVLNVEKRLEDL